MRKTTVQIMYWHGIPVQVKAKAGRQRVSKQLPLRFMAAVDAAAMASKSVDGDSYSEGFEWGEPKPYEGTPEEAANAVVAELDAAHPEIDHRAIALRLREARKTTDTE